MSDDIKDDELKDKSEDAEPEELELEAGSGEPDFAPTAAAPAFEEEDIEADPHAAFDTPVETEDPHMDIYGDAGSPYAEDDEEEVENYDGDSDSY